MRTRCATGLRYSPWTGSQRSKLWRWSACRQWHGLGQPELVAYGSDGRVGVLVVELVADAAGDVDDRGGWLGGGDGGRGRSGALCPCLVRAPPDVACSSGLPGGALAG